MTRPLAPIGARNPKVLVLSDAPDPIEARERLPFSSNAHKNLRKYIANANLPFNICQFMYFCESPFVKPEQIIIAQTKKEATRFTEMGLVMQANLRKYIEEINPMLIIASGPISLFALTGRWGIDKWRGSILSPTWNENNGQWVMPILPPWRTMFNDTHMRHVTMMDLRKVVKFIDNGAVFKSRTCHIDPSMVEATDFLNYVYAEGLAGKIVYFDIEVKHLELNCIGFSVDASEAMCIPLMNELGNYYTIAHEMELMRLIAKILCNKTYGKCGQNVIFDTHFLLRKYGLRITGLDDTMIAQHTLWHEFPKGLDMITSMYTDIPYYKDDGKDWFKGGGSYEKLWRYNCFDVLSCAEAFPQQVEELIETNQLKTYERQRSIIEPCVYMMERGVKVDEAVLAAERLKYEKRLEPLRAEFTKLVPDVNARSSTQLKQLFYGQMGHKEITNKHKKVTTDVLALKRLASQGVREASLILQIRKDEKILSTYFSQNKFDSDGRIRCQYKPVGTAYSRLASAQSFFGTGMNMQNWPHSALICLTPDEDYIFYAFDLSQAENRIVAYVGRIEQMIDAFETGKDVHSLTASLIFQKPVEEISDEPGSSTIGGGVLSERGWGKRANHGLNYGFEAKAFAMMYEISLKEAIRITDGYHNAYPGVRNGFHAHVKECIKKDHAITNLMGRTSRFLSIPSNETFMAAYACIPQGSVGDIINERGMSYVYYNRQSFESLELLGQVHDSICFQLPKSIGWLEHARMIQMIKDNLEQPLTTHYGRSFVIPADLAMGLSLQKESGREIKAKKWPKSLEDLAAALEKNYQELTYK